jgi:hypothetical protein
MIVIKKIGSVYGNSSIQIYDKNGVPKVFGQMQTDIAGKQDLLISSVNIKTINGNSILGAGDLIVSGSGLTQEQVEGLI